MSAAALRVLVVDDEPFIRNSVAMLLTLEGHTVFCAPDGVAGLLLAQQQRPDVVLTDRYMPQQGGYGLLAALRGDAALAHTRVVMLTGDATPDTCGTAGVGLQPDACLIKPFTRAQLLAVLSAPAPA